MKELFDSTSVKCSRVITQAYSTSFSLGILCLGRELRDAVHSVYGFVRLADEIVDSFHRYDKAALLNRFREDTYRAIAEKISLNPVLNSFQHVVHQFNIEKELLDCFLKSMEMDLTIKQHDRATLREYIMGSAEAVGLMCLRIFTRQNDGLYRQLRPAAMSLGAAFQKVNFLRDMNADFSGLGRVYFPGLHPGQPDPATRRAILEDIEKDFSHALAGIKKLPASARFGVYVAYVYYRALFRKIRQMPVGVVRQHRVRIPNPHKATLLAYSYIKHQFNLL